MADTPKTPHPKRLPRPQYLPEFGLPSRKPIRPSNVPATPPGMYLTETGRPNNNEKK